MTLEGAQIQDKESAKSMVNEAQGSVNEVNALLPDMHLKAPQ